MDNKQIEGTVERIKAWMFWKEKSGVSFDEDGKKDLEALLSLAQLFLSVKEMPKKQDLTKEEIDKYAVDEVNDIGLFNGIYKMGYNLCHDEFSAWLAGRITVEKIQEIILNNILKYEKGQELNVLGAAQAIKTMILGGEK